jgi:O-antigen/teichoic acid export membrane protein
MTDPTGTATSAHPPGSDTQNLGELTLAGVRWMSVSRLIAESSGLIASVILARLLTPADFGYTAVAVFLVTLAVVTQQGVGSFLVAHKSPSPGHFEAAYFVSLVVGAVGAGLTLLLAVTIARPIFGDQAATFAALSSPAWLLASIAAVPTAQLQRQLSFGRLGMIQAVGSVAMPAASIFLAMAGLGGEALVIGALVASCLTALLSLIFSRPPRPRWSRVETVEILDYGAPAAGGSILYAAVRNVDYILLAAFVPAFQVGLYMRAFTLGSDYQSKISQILVSVAFPVLSRASGFDDLRRMRMRMIRVHVSVLFPLLFGLIAVAPEFVPWMYGAPWADAGLLTQILAVGGMVAAVGTGTGPLLMATGHARAVFGYNLFGFVLYTVAVLASVQFGITAVCVAVVGARLIGFIAMQYVIVERRVGIPVLETARDDVLPALVAGLPQLAVTMLGMHACQHAGIPVGASLLLSVAAGLVTNTLIARALFPATWADLMLIVRRVTALRAPQLNRLSSGSSPPAADRR